MPKKAKGKKQQKKKSSGGGSKGKGANSMAKMSRPVSSRHAAMQLHRESSHLAMCNPFSHKTIGCKYPDGGASLSLPVQVRGLYAEGVTAAGVNCFAISPQYGYNVLGATITSTTWTFAASASQVFNNTLMTTLAGAGAQFRPVCAGIVIRSTQSAMNAQGTIILTKVGSGVAPGSTWAQGQLQAEAATYPITAGMQICVLFKPVGPMAYDYHGMNSVNFEAFDWDQVVIELIGCVASSTPLEIEFICNYEVQVNASTMGYGQLARPTNDNPVARAVTKSTWSKIGSFIEGGVEYATKKIMDVAAATAVGMIAGPEGGVAAGTMALLVD